MRSFALSAVGADRPGIIAAIAERLSAHGLNVTDSQMGILRGFFAITLVLEAESVDEDALRADLAQAAEELRLEAFALNEVGPDRGGAGLDAATHVVSVHGADHPGILASVTGGLAAAGVNVCDLRTRLVEEDAVYVMVVDIALPAAVDDSALRAALQTIAEQQGVNVSLQPADADTL